MPLICYQPHKFDSISTMVIDKSVDILEEYARQGYDLTLRQLYYQFVAHDYFPDDRRWKWLPDKAKWVKDDNGTKNADPNYKWLGEIVNNARLAGLIDWSHITDRTRNMKENSHWGSPQSIIDACGKQYQINKWATQDNYVEGWIEKDALLGILEMACKPLDIPYFSCRGYTSQSEMWSASQRLLEKVRQGKTVTIIHLGDHDPSGIDMSRDIEDRLVMFMRHHIARDAAKDRPRLEGEDHDQYVKRLEGLIMGHEYKFTTPVTINRIALNMDQVEEYNPPPNPAKMTDARARGYVEKFGDESWELDALEPAVLTGLIRHAVEELRDEEAWDKAVEKERQERSQLATVASRWTNIVKGLK